MLPEIQISTVLFFLSYQFKQTTQSFMLQLLNVIEFIQLIFPQSASVRKLKSVSAAQWTQTCLDIVWTELSPLNKTGTFTKVANVMAIYDDLWTQWRPIQMSEFRANIFLIRTTYGPQKFPKIRFLKVNFFHLPMHLTNE